MKERLRAWERKLSQEREEWESDRQRHSIENQHWLERLAKYQAEEDAMKENIKAWERELAQKKEQERREREQMRLYWADVEGAEKCSGHEVMAYMARLENLLPSIDAIMACKATPITINGITYDGPNYCEDRVRTNLS